MSFWDNLFNRNRLEKVEHYDHEHFEWYMQLYTEDKNTSKFCIKKALNNPALMLAIKLNADLFSLVRINSYKDGVIEKENYLHTLKKQPNPFQTWEQFLYDYKFWKDLAGTSYVYNSDSDFKSAFFYVLRPDYIYITDRQYKEFAKIINSQKALNDLMKETIKYQDCYDNKYIYKLSEIKAFFSLSNGLSGNWFKGNSIVESIWKNIVLADEILDSQSVNVRMASKFLAMNTEGNDTSRFNTFGDEEKRDIERKVTSKKPVHAVKNPMDIKRFSDNIANLKLDEQYLNQYFYICKAFGIPRDVAEANLSGSTYENQEKSLGKYISQGLQPDIDDLTSYFESKFGIEELKGSWTHLPFMQVYEKERSETREKNIKTLLSIKDTNAYTEQEFNQMIRDEIEK